MASTRCTTSLNNSTERGFCRSVRPPSKILRFSSTPPWRPGPPRRRRWRRPCTPGPPGRDRWTDAPRRRHPPPGGHREADELLALVAVLLQRGVIDGQDIPRNGVDDQDREGHSIVGLPVVLDEQGVRGSHLRLPVPTDSFGKRTAIPRPCGVCSSCRCVSSLMHPFRRTRYHRRTPAGGGSPPPVPPTPPVRASPVRAAPQRSRP